jgi:hypothetical protein
MRKMQTVPFAKETSLWKKAMRLRQHALMSKHQKTNAAYSTSEMRGTTKTVWPGPSRLLKPLRPWQKANKHKHVPITTWAMHSSNKAGSATR